MTSRHGLLNANTTNPLFGKRDRHKMEGCCDITSWTTRGSIKLLLADHEKAVYCFFDKNVCGIHAPRVIVVVEQPMIHAHNTSEKCSKYWTCRGCATATYKGSGATPEGLWTPRWDSMRCNTRPYRPINLKRISRWNPWLNAWTQRRKHRSG